MTVYNINIYTRRGMERERNEDACGVGDMFLYGRETGQIKVTISDGGLPVLITVADGMGGHQNGDIASRSAVEQLTHIFLDLGDDFDIDKGIVDTHVKIQTLAEGRHGAYAMGTTIVGAVLKSNEAMFFNVGDSRAYRVRKRKIVQVSVDDVNLGEYGSGMTQCLGGGITVLPKPHIKSYDVLPGDVLVLVSDGISDVVPDGKIIDIVSSTTTDCAFDLCEEAVRRGGGDDTSAVICVA